MRSFRVPIRDIIIDAYSNVRSRLGRSLGVGIAAALGVATLVGAVQLAASADAQVQQRIEQQRPEVLKAQPVQSSSGLFDHVTNQDLRKVAGLDGVRAVTLVQRLSEPAQVTVGAHRRATVALAGVDGDLMAATHVRVTGRSFSKGELRSGAHVSLVGRRVAADLDLPDPVYRPTIWINGTSYSVIGLLDDSDLTPDLIDQISVPRSTLLRDMGPTPGDFDSVLYVRAQKDDVPRLAAQFPLWLRPAHPEDWRVEVPRTSLDLATAISSDVRSLSIASGVLVLLIGAVGIGNATLRSIYERLQELGLRRALGARASHIVGLLLIEAAAVGLLAGAVGTAVGLAVAAAVATWNEWPLAFNPTLIIVGIALAVVAAVVGAAMPIRVASRVSPAEALRRD